MSSCNCSSESCIECKSKELNKIKKKLNRYEEAFKILMDDSIIQENFMGEEDNLFESVIIEKNSDGEMIKKYNSKFGESFMIVDNGANLNHLSNKEKNALQAQNDLRNYEKVSEYAKKGSFLYGVGKTVASVAGFFIGLF